jgi:hypothetical protein
MYGRPKPDDANGMNDFGGLMGDHGSPVWEKMWFYHNTYIKHTTGWRSYYGFELGR